MMPSTLLLVHSPLLGPSSWRPLAEVARSRGVDVICPDLTGLVDADPPQWRHLVDTAVRSAVDCSEVIVVGHSGAGAVLPTIAQRIEDRLRALVFVDGIVPPVAGEHVTSQRFLEFIDGKVVDGRLPGWLDWWPPQAVNEMLQSNASQDELRADMPQLSRSFYDEAIPVPHGWSNFPCAYLKLSAAYDQEFDEVGDRGWPRMVIGGTHLSIFTDPSGVLDAIEDLLVKVEPVSLL